MMSLILTRTLKIVAVLFIETFVFGMGELHGEEKLDDDREFASKILFVFFAVILAWLVW